MEDLKSMVFVASDLLAIWTIIQEARNQPIEGMIAVGEVIRTRTENKIQSDGTVESTILKPFQFSGWNTLDPNRIDAFRVPPEILTKATYAWNHSYIYKNKYSLGATHYYNPKIVVKTPDWALKGIKLTTIGDHDFYKVE